MQKLVAEKRELLGRKVKRLRAEGELPANIYGRKVKSLAVKIPYDKFEKVYKEEGETGLIEINIGKTKRPVLVHNVQTDPVTDKFIHVDFLQVDLKQKVTADVPVEIVGESPAEKQGLGVVVQQIDEIEVEALPTDLPERFEVDISNLEEVDSAVYVKDLKVDKKKVEIKVDPEEIIVKVEPPREEEEEVPPQAEEEVIEGEEETEEREAEGEVVEETEEPAEEKGEEQS
jgi:large subunit ribosomal protein L25